MIQKVVTLNYCALELLFIIKVKELSGGRGETGRYI